MAALSLREMYCPTCGSNEAVEIEDGDTGVCWNCRICWAVERLDDEEE